MAENTKGAAGNTAVPSHGDHDRVAMLSLKADGSPDQHRPEIIGDKEFALEATKRQFTEQAVSAVDQAERGVAADTGAETVGQDPEIEKLQKKHEAAEKDAVAAAESTVSALFTDDEKLQAGTDKPAGRKPAQA
jgi:hypothetical protein